MRAVVVALALLAATPAEASAGGWTWPVEGEVVSPFDYGRASPYAGGRHRGIDIAAAPGTPVVAAAGGTVRFAGMAGSSGLTVSVRTADGRYDTSYLHLSSIAVGAGQTFAAGERIGASGTSGSPSSTEPHLHFGVRTAGTSHGYRDPLALLPPLPRSPETPRGVPVAAPAPVRVGPRAVPVRAPRFEPATRPAAVAPASAPATLHIGVAIAIACTMLAAALIASSIGLSCRTTSRRRSTTSTASRTSATSTRPSPPTCSPATCASATTTSSS